MLCSNGFVVENGKKKSQCTDVQHLLLLHCVSVRENRKYYVVPGAQILIPRQTELPDGTISGGRRPDGTYHRVHRVVTAAVWRTFYHEGKIGPGW